MGLEENILRQKKREKSQQKRKNRQNDERLYNRGFCITYHTLLLLSCIVWLVFYNNLFWLEISNALAHNGGFFMRLVMSAAYILIFWLALEILSLRIWVKPLLCALFIICAVSSYFMDLLKIYLNGEIIAALFDTNAREASDYLNSDLAKNMLIYALLPCVAIIFVPLKRQKFKHEIFSKFKIMFALALGIWGLYVLQGENIIFTIKQSKRPMYALNPLAPIRAVISYKIDDSTLPKVYEQIGLDARIKPNFQNLNSAPDSENLDSENAQNPQNLAPKNFVLVIGESARAANWQLNGYERPTNAYTAQIQNLINFENFYSCGVITGVSIPCLLSNFTRSNYTNRDLGRWRDNVLDIAKRAGYEVFWISNNGGECMGGVCERLDKDKVFYFNSDENFDGDMLPRFEQILKNSSSHKLIVLNLVGSHGARYDLRYPKDFEKFKPVCSDPNLSTCARVALLNAYDNSILYTDFVLAQILKMLENCAGACGLWYMSDHGESLGESGQFMHGGLPYRLAPDFQKHIPSMMWLNSEFLQELDLQISQSSAKEAQNVSQNAQDSQDEPQIALQILKNVQKSSLSQDFVFHTLLRLLSIETSAYEPHLDILNSQKGAK